MINSIKLVFLCFYFLFRPLFRGFLKLVQKYTNIFVRFLVQMETLKFAFEIYWPLAVHSSTKCTKTSLISQCHYQILFLLWEGANKLYEKCINNALQFFIKWTIELHLKITFFLINETNLIRNGIVCHIERIIFLAPFESVHLNKWQE